MAELQAHLVDGTYELFRHFYGAPRSSDATGNERGAVRGVLASMLGMLRGGATHVGVATDHVIESFRNDMWPGYKRGDGIDPELLTQFEPLEEGLRSMGVTVWAMVEHEADDALAAAAAHLTADSRIGRILICTPDKDLAQCVVGERVIQLDRRRRETRDEAGVVERFGVPPAAIPDYLALVGDSADGFPGVRGWGAKSTAIVLGHYGFLEAIPHEVERWEVKVRGAARLAGALREQWDEALLFRELATLRTDALADLSAEEIAWAGPREDFQRTARSLGDPALFEQARALAAARAGG